MYIPRHYQETNDDEIVAFMRRYSFATLVTIQDGLPVASHLPFVVEQTTTGIHLLSHVARANPQWKDMEIQTALVIFSEPHAYISPRHYEQENNVPTWNYISVHAYGRAEMLDEPEASYAMLEAMIDAFEKEYKQQWQNMPDAFKEKMLKGIVGFRINVDSVQAKKKLSQNKKPGERQNIIKALEQSDHSAEKEIAAYMRALEKTNL
jgi:transcriptional regulator